MSSLRLTTLLALIADYLGLNCAAGVTRAFLPPASIVGQQVSVKAADSIWQRGARPGQCR